MKMKVDNFYTWPDFHESENETVTKHVVESASIEILALSQMFDYWETNTAENAELMIT